VIKLTWAMLCSYERS